MMKNTHLVRNITLPNFWEKSPI